MDHGFKTIDVKNIQKSGLPIKVQLKVTNDRVPGTDVHRKVSDYLGVEEAARGLFSLFIVEGKKKRKVQLNEFLPLQLIESNLTFEKWCFDQKVEKKVLRSPGCVYAQHLLFLHAQRLIEEGKLIPTTEQMQELESCLDPNFCTEKQYVEICHGVKDYFSFKAEECQLLADIEVPSGKLCGGRGAVVTLSHSGVSILSGAHIEISWHSVKWWSLCPRRQCVTFSLMLSCKTPVTVALETPQAELLISAVMEFIKNLQVDNPDLPPFLSSMVKSPPDGSTVWENSIFGAL